MVDPHIKVNIPKISFKDVAGMREAKQEVMEFVEYMKFPQKFAVSRTMTKNISSCRSFVSGFRRESSQRSASSWSTGHR